MDCLNQMSYSKYESSDEMSSNVISKSFSKEVRVESSEHVAEIVGKQGQYQLATFYFILRCHR